MSVPLWEIETSWFQESGQTVGQSTFAYKDWADFMMNKPYKFWKPYVLSSWSWKKVEEIPRSNRHHLYELALNSSNKDSSETKEKYKLQIVFLTKNIYSQVTRAEMFVETKDEQAIRDWLKKHMPNFWKI
jgi:hypothetical protein